MKKIIFIFFIFLIFGVFLWLTMGRDQISGAPPYGVVDNPPKDKDLYLYSFLKDWKRPGGPAKVALQVGHWKNDEVPEELKNLRGNTGASGGGMSEWEVNYNIATLTAEILRAKGIIVEILPATIPPKYWADVFVAIHADGNEDPNMSGFKSAVPRRDLTDSADELLYYVEHEYEKATNMLKDPEVSRNMRGYYAFGWWRYHHALHPMTTALILETGFLTSPTDRYIIVDAPEISANGLSNGIISYLSSKNLIEKDY